MVSLTFSASTAPTGPRVPGLEVSALGSIEYLAGWQLQRDLHAEVADGSRENTLLLVEHPSVYTAGRRTELSDRPINGVPVIDVDRGGKITWHGPGQLVGYPIVKLKQATNVVGFVRTLEAALISICAELGLEAQQYCERSGVWIRDEKGDRKIAAIGIRVARGTVTHGFALNVNPDLKYFTEIIPCGLPDVITTSLEQELGRSITIKEILPIAEKHLQEALIRVIA
ncbi:MAG: lipoyl(octanoyl) transferase LipB [Actinobacteria bacterium]|uniref:lipoyl(octanoyl) transferase n=1 Tax=freshwater metagenome TaxID=449393 RepID=A0A6J6GLJ7_9ZZZZ|nr:lipoyl(octanoyl) transferase LipB [Actinomycetota bacterium]MSY04940.1 lipoyl(octanoyl) transferase LipB [Actinomycetota bacterium]MSY67517.1 lipoyl(octanoyl) transferase LipB [Actinomycetota bacterium]MSZ58960.1 lipoyl(octanoyl) transferase LipB [Actinomycetota bacterium]MTA01178.1 lipoyl(octanoyl) transferase LipB [Actinomycetota bacterium]